MSKRGLPTFSAYVGRKPVQVRDKTFVPEWSLSTFLTELWKYKEVKVLMYGTYDRGVFVNLDRARFAADINTILKRSETESVPYWFHNTIKYLVRNHKLSRRSNNLLINRWTVIDIGKAAKAEVMRSVEYSGPAPKNLALDEVRAASFKARQLEKFSKNELSANRRRRVKVTLPERKIDEKL